MRFYKNYVALILLLALTLNWVVEGSNYLGKVDMNLNLFPKFSIMVVEVFQFLVLLRLLLLYPRNRFIMASTVAVAVFCVFEFMVFMAVKADPLVWVSGIRYYFSFFPLLLIAYLLASNGYSLKREFNWLMLLVLFQVPVAVYQFFNLSDIQIVNDRQLLYDIISGTMGGIASNLMSLVIGIALLYFLIKFVEEKRPLYIVLACLLVVPPILAEAKGMLIVIFIVLLYLAFVYKFSLSRFLLLGGLATLLLVGFNYTYTLLGYGEPITLTYLIDYVQSESGGGRLSRIDSIVHSFSLLSNNDTLFLGMGIGNANKSPLGQDGQYYDFYTIRHSIDILVAETGLLGIVLFSFLIARMIWVSRSLLKNKYGMLQKDELLLTRVFLGSVFVFIYGLFWVDVLYRVQFMYPFGMMAGYVIGLHARVNAVEEPEEALQYQLQK
ncbi:hypothetical protein MKJ04_04670 [Pontibacter sp. E15-1]|uniref:hypothetical protein n=1 Tax=Pontibacter sp. E15-1 TaxID=2919918 RepID=UPI001F4F4CB5|nr:hypothetical protein [Pontibacter sp. E15-1]MCJ8164124.1 hypothetical protein [Pontibacter sp. E15-1]